MKEVSFDEYLNDLHEFAQKHNANGDCQTFTSNLEGEKYTKVYSWSDGAQFYEVNDIVWEPTTVRMHGIEIPVYVRLHRTEYWSSEFGSRYVYQNA